MIGLFGTLNLGVRSLQAQRQGVEVAGHNLANVNNPAYSRQRINLQTSLTLPTPFGPQGTGVDVASIQQMRSAVLDSQIQTEASVRGFLDAKQRALQSGEAILGQQIDRQSSGAQGAAATGAGGGQTSIAEGLSAFFNAFQSLSIDPTSLSERQAVTLQGQNLSSQFREVDSRLGQLQTDLNQTLESDVASANDLLTTIAGYNSEIAKAESGAPGSANDLRDLRQQKVEELGKLANVRTSEQSDGIFHVSISGVTVVSGATVADTLETYDAGGGQRLVRVQTAGTPLALTGGSIQGTVEARDATLQGLRSGLDELAGLMITQVNALHRVGFNLTGGTGAVFFSGTTAADIDVNSAVSGDPSALQVAGASGAVGDNRVALALAQLANQPQAALSNQTFSQSYAQTVAGYGNSVAVVNGQISDQTVVEKMLLRQRDSVSGVSLDEEMTDLIKFQKAFEASAHLITTVDEMLDTILNLTR